MVLDFYPRSPCGERLGAITYVVMTPDFYPRSPCGERPGNVLAGHRRPHFYPRSPCGERRWILGEDNNNFKISIHALLAESDWAPRWTECRHPPFLSTLSLRRATTRERASIKPIFNFYPRSPCGERRKPSRLKSRRCVFLSTLSLRRATQSSGAGWL